ncbi:MAG: hypothetical protein GF393_02360, partial [Armatimonadia bacterium]|nr:hypothetical protein [Armatimonadia bacterium]
MKPLRMATVLALPLVATSLCTADNPVQVETSLRQVSVFRNGMCFAVREAQLPDRAGQMEVSPLPVASQGTFWLAWSEGVRLGDVMTRPVALRETRTARSLAELLAANVGKQVILHLRGEEGETLKGTLMSAPAPVARPTVSPHIVQPLGGEEIKPDLLLIRTAGRSPQVIGIWPERVV